MRRPRLHVPNPVCRKTLRALTGKDNSSLEFPADFPRCRVYAATSYLPACLANQTAQYLRPNHLATRDVISCQVPRLRQHRIISRSFSLRLDSSDSGGVGDWGGGGAGAGKEERNGGMYEER